MKKLLLTLCAFAATLTFAQAQKTPTIATIEVQKVLAEYRESAAMAKAIETSVAQARAQTEGALKRLQELQAEIEKLQKDAEDPLANDTARTDAKTRATTKYQEYLKMREVALQQERTFVTSVQARQQENAKTIADKMRPIVEALAKEKKYDLVLDSSFSASIVWYANPAFDITDEVVRRLNTAFDKENATDAAPAPEAK